MPSTEVMGMASRGVCGHDGSDPGTGIGSSEGLVARHVRGGRWFGLLVL